MFVLKGFPSSSVVMERNLADAPSLWITTDANGTHRYAGNACSHLRVQGLNHERYFLPSIFQPTILSVFGKNVFLNAVLHRGEIHPSTPEFVFVLIRTPAS